jgi:hypothetical protein
LGFAAAKGVFCSASGPKGLSLTIFIDLPSFFFFFKLTRQMYPHWPHSLNFFIFLFFNICGSYTPICLHSLIFIFFTYICCNLATRWLPFRHIFKVSFSFCFLFIFVLIVQLLGSSLSPNPNQYSHITTKENALFRL